MQSSIRAACRHYARRDDAVNQVVPVLEQYKGQLYHESTDFTHDDGRVELLLQLTGVLPVSIGAATYHCPVALWLPLDFPTKPPMVFVIPSATLAVKSGPNVDPSGKVSLPYLENWARKGEGCSLLVLISELIPRFSARYPVVTRQQQPTRPPPPPASPAPAATQAPPRPPPPPGGGRPLSGTDQLARTSSGARRDSVGSTSDAPPRPPPPPGAAAGAHGVARPVSGYQPPPPGYPSPPPLPPPQRQQTTFSPFSAQGGAAARPTPPPRQPSPPRRPTSIGSPSQMPLRPPPPPQGPPPPTFAAPPPQPPPPPAQSQAPPAVQEQRQLNGHAYSSSQEIRPPPPPAPPVQPRPPSQSFSPAVQAQPYPAPQPHPPQQPPNSAAQAPRQPPFQPQSPLRQPMPPPQQQRQQPPPPPPSSHYSSHYEPTIRPDSRNSSYDERSTYAPTVDARSYAPSADGRSYAPSTDGRSYAPTSIDGRSYAPTFDGRSYAPTDRSVTPPAHASPSNHRQSSGSYQPRQAQHAYQSQEMGHGFQPTLQGGRPRSAVPPPPSSIASTLSEEYYYHQQQQLARASTMPAAASRPPRASHPRKPNLNILDSEPEDLSSAETSPQSFHHPDGSVASSSHHSSAPPPLPPNPALLALRTRLHSKLSLSLSALNSQTQQDLQKMDMYEVDLLKGEPAILDEMQRLEVVRGVCENVRARYKAVVEEGEKRLREYEARGDGPEVDEIVCSSTVVYNQLLDLVAEDAALEDTIYHLGRGLSSDTANIDLDRFLKRVRGLAREQFQKRATINKILLALAARGQSRSGTPSAGATATTG